MKKTIMIAGIMAMSMLGGCGQADEEASPTRETPQAQQVKYGYGNNEPNTTKISQEMDNMFKGDNRCYFNQNGSFAEIHIQSYRGDKPNKKELERLKEIADRLSPFDGLRLHQMTEENDELIISLVGVK
jgi:hypothetical protein